VKTSGRAQALQVCEGFIVGCAGPVLKLGFEPFQIVEIKEGDNLHPCCIALATVTCPLAVTVAMSRVIQVS